MPDRVKCLHALVAHELAAGEVNPFGREALQVVGDWWLSGPCIPDRRQRSLRKPQDSLKFAGETVPREPPFC
jgi:hypothetical protein